MRGHKIGFIAVAKAAGKCLRHLHIAEHHHRHQPHGHEEKHHGKQRIDVADQFVDGEKRGKQIIHKNHRSPERGVEGFGCKRCNKAGCGDHKHATHQNKQDNGEYTHHLLHARAKFLTHYLRERDAAGPQGNHTRHEIMDCTGENGAQHYPQICGRAIHDAHYRTEDGAETGDVKELDQKYFPSGHGYKIHTVVVCYCRCGAVRLDAEHALHKETIDEIAADKHGQCRKK